MTVAFGGLTPSVSSQMTLVPRILEFQFGAGLKQTAPDGINYMLETWDLYFMYIDQTAFNSLMTWISTYGDPTMIFSTTMFGNSVAKTYRMSSDAYQITYYPGNIYTVEAHFEQVY